MANLQNFYKEIESQIFIVDSWINEDGLGIQYLNGSKELEISLDPYDAAELLAKYHIVAACNKEAQILEEDFDGFMKWRDWESYARGNRLSESTAREIVIGEERLKALQNESLGEMAYRHAKIRALIGFVHPSKPAI